MAIRHEQLANQRRVATIQVITPVQHRVLAAVGQLHFLTAQLMGWLLGHSPKSERHTQKLLQGLVTAGLLMTVPLPRFGRHGRPALVYCLTQQGIRYLSAHGIAVKQRFRPSDSQRYSYLLLDHTLALNAVLVGISRWAEAHPAYTLHELRHERDLVGQAALVELRDGRNRKVCVDAWLDLRIGTQQLPIAIEYDRDTEHRGAWTEKVEGLVRWAQGSYASQFGTPYLTIAVVTSAKNGDKRLRDLLRWAEAVLTDLDAVTDAALFRFTSLAPQPTQNDLEQLFAMPRWYTPFGQTASSLLPELQETMS